MVIKEPEVAMINASAEALNYISRKPGADMEEVMKYVIKMIDAKGKVKIAAIAAADRAIKLRIKEPGLSDKQVIQEITNNVFHILADIKISEG